MRVLLAVVLVVAVGVSGAVGPGARAGQSRLRHPGHRQRLVRLRRHHRRAAAQDAAAGLEHRRQAARRRRRQPAAGGQERDAARPVVHRDQPLGRRGQGGLHREAREPPRARRRLRHLLPRRDGHQEARDHLGARDPRQEAAGPRLHPAGRLARRVRRAPAPARDRPRLQRDQGLRRLHPARRLQRHHRRLQGRPRRHPVRGGDAQAPVGERDRVVGGRGVPRPRRRTPPRRCCRSATWRPPCRPTPSRASRSR